VHHCFKLIPAGVIVPSQRLLQKIQHNPTMDNVLRQRGLIEVFELFEEAIHLLVLNSHSG
jgi:hypothetical protein